MTLDDLIARLHGEGRLRVWSLAVTVFGDAVAPRGGTIAMSDLSAVLERLGAEPGAVRTAMSRLARDGYVERERKGRRSFYRLSPRAAAEFERAGARIYAAEPPEWDGTWTIAIAPEGAGEAPGFTRIAPGAWIAPGAAAAPDGFFTISGGRGDAPEWARQILSPPELTRRYSEIAECWERFDTAAVGGLNAAAARVLLIHDWRRVLLRDAPLPRALRPAGWAGAEARMAVAAAYRALAPAAERWLDECAAPGERRLPPANAAFAARFRA